LLAGIISACKDQQAIGWQQVLMQFKVVRPLLVLKKLLTHKEHRDARCGQANAGRDTGAAAGKPRSGVDPIPDGQGFRRSPFSI